MCTTFPNQRLISTVKIGVRLTFGIALVLTTWMAKPIWICSIKIGKIEKNNKENVVTRGMESARRLVVNKQWKIIHATEFRMNFMKTADFLCFAVFAVHMLCKNWWIRKSQYPIFVLIQASVREGINI